MKPLDQENAPATERRGTSHRIAVVLPCYNEEAAIARVVAAFRQALPDATVHVFDNASTDGTSEEALSAGAVVRQVALKGKGNVVRRMFADVDADIYVMADGDDTYDASAAPQLIEKLIHEQLDMVVGSRVDAGEAGNYRPGHRFGNLMLTRAARSIFGGSFADMLSGFRVFSRRYAKSFPAEASGFEIETELTVHALALRMPYAELETRYGARPEGSVSKLSTYRDGWRILLTILGLFAKERPLYFFGLIALVLAMGSVGIVIPVFAEYLATGLVPRFPTAILSVGMMLSAMLSLVCGVLADIITLGRRETRHLRYLAIPPVANGRGSER